MAGHADRSRLSRRWTLLASALLALTTSLVPTTAAAQVPVRTIDAACPAGQTPHGGFADTGRSPFDREIDCVVAFRVAQGLGSRAFAPGQQVTRGQMASFLANVLEAAGRTRPVTLPDRFRDDDRSPHEGSIDWLAHLGILTGFGDGTSRPDAPVTREQLATFLNRVVAEVTGSRLRGGADRFEDDDRSPHEPNIDALADAGIVAGIDRHRFGPGRPVTRGQMAAVLARLLAHLVDHGHLRPIGDGATFAVAPANAATLPTSTTAGDGKDRGRRSYTVTVPAGVTTVDIALLPADAVVRTNAGLRFASVTPLGGDRGASIEVVNGSAHDAADGRADVTHVRAVRVRDRVVTFAVDAISPLTVVPIVFEDRGGARGRLDVDGTPSASTPRRALERFGVGGATTWALGEPALDSNPPLGTVRDVDPAGGWYTLDVTGGPAPDVLVRMAGGDSYAYTASRGGPGAVTRAEFLAWLSPGDRVDPGTYRPGRTSHTIAGDVPAAPTGVAAGMDGRDVVITFVKPTNPVADDAASRFVLQRAAVTGGSTGTFRDLVTRSGDQDARFSDRPPAGTFAYRIVARSVTGDSPPSAIATSAPTGGTLPPTARSSSIDDNGAGGGRTGNRVLDQGDRLTFTFDRAVTLGSAWAIDLVDRDGTLGRLGHDVATATLSSGGTVLTVTVGRPGPTVLRRGADGELDLEPSSRDPARTGLLQVRAASGIGNAAGAWNLAQSGLPRHPTGRVLLDGSGAGRLTPDAPGGALRASATDRRVDLGRDEVQRISAHGRAEGSFTLTYPQTGQTTVPLPATATAGEIAQALAALPAIGAGNIEVSGGPLHQAAVTIRFVGARGGQDHPRLRIRTGGLRGGSGDPAVTTVEDGAAASGLEAGDLVLVHTSAGVLVGSGTATHRGRASVGLSAGVSPGATLLVVVEDPVTLRSSRTAEVSVR